MKKIAYKGWKNCYRLSNGIIDLIVTADVGPRVIRFGFAGGENEFKEYAPDLGKRGGRKWRAYGGHRLWHAPEVDPRTYFPDNFPVQVEKHAGFVRVIQPVETTTGVQKEVDLRLSPRKAHVQLTHRLRNTNPWAIELAPWSLSMMATGGTCIFPLPPRGSHPKHLAPASTLTLWAYTDMSDPRWTWGRRHVLLRQDSSAKEPQKIGASVPDGWAAYARDGRLFLKCFPYCDGARYADFGCNFEAFTNKDTLEVETLGPLMRLAPGGSVEHVENWFLFRGVPTPDNDAVVDKHVLPKVRSAQRRRS